MKKPIRVLQVIGMMDRGGAEAFIMNTYRNIDRNKVQFDFIVHTQAKCAYDDEIKALGGRVYNAVPRYTGWNHLEYVRQWQEFFREHREYKLVHGHIRSTAAIYLYIAKQYGLRTIAHTHSTSSGSGFAWLAREVLRYPIRYIAEHLFACAQVAGHWAYGNKKFHVLKNAIDCANFAFDASIRYRLRQELGVEKMFVIGHVGRMRPEKNHRFLLEIFAKVLAENHKARLILVGDGELLAEVQDKASELGVRDQVHFVGSVDNVQDYLQAMDVIVFPSIYEGLPVSIVESQAAGLPHILSDVITREIDMGLGLVEFMSLRDSAQAWAQRVLSKQIENRTIDMQKIVDNGYDAGENAKRLQDFYVNIN